jgi:hypothetical protein
MKLALNNFRDFVFNQGEIMAIRERRVKRLSTLPNVAIITV